MTCQVATFGTFALLYTVTESFILPYIPTFERSILRSSLDLALPFMMAYLLLFFIIFGKLFAYMSLDPVFTYSGCRMYL